MIATDPGEPDIPGIPPGTLEDGVNYSFFVEELLDQVKPGTEISVCAPASFWYLQAYEIQSMAIYLDYVIFMTYDLHGQWDYGSAFSDPGCPGLGCLRSDVNLTETLNAMSSKWAFHLTLNLACFLLLSDPAHLCLGMDESFVFTTKFTLVTN